MQQPIVSNYIKRFFILFCGLAIMAVGVTFSIKATLGISPISCFPYVLNQVFGIFTVGQFTTAMHVFFVLLQIPLLRRDFSIKHVLQLAVAVVFGTMIDVSLFIFADIAPSSYLQQFFFLSLSIILLSFGIFLEVKANVLFVAGEGLVKAISSTFSIDFGKVKVFFDSFLVLISLIVGLGFNHQVIGVREGTILAALFVGAIVKILGQYIHFLDNFVSIKTSNERRSTKAVQTILPYSEE